MLGITIQAVSLSTWFIVVVGALPIYFLVNVIYNLYFHPLAHIPGPFWARASGIPSWYHASRGRRHIWLWRQFQLYGNRIRVAPNLILFRDPEAHATIYSMKANVQRSRFYLSFKRNENDSNTMSTIDFGRHAAKRKILNVCFTEKSVLTTSSFIIKHIDRWNQLLLEQNTNVEGWSAPVNFAEELTKLLFDIMGDISFGKSFDLKEPGENVLKEVPELIAEYVQFFYPIGHVPFLDLLLWLKPRGLDQLVELITPPSIKQYYDFLERSVTERLLLHDEDAKKPEEERRRDMFYFLREARDPDTGALALDRHSLLSESNLLIVAGTDTAATSLASIFFYLSGSREACQKLSQEIHSTWASADDIVYGPKLMGCKYLKACIDEGMRLLPTSPSEFQREVLSGGLYIKGEYYPPGTIVGTSGWCNSRNEEIYEDPGVFKPERWLVDEKTGVTKEAVARIRANFTPFLSGPGSCVGKNIAMAEMMLTVAKTLHRLEIRRMPGSTMGCGSPELGWGADDKTQMQAIDAFVSVVKGPELQFRRRVN